MTEQQNSLNSINEANRSRARFSGHGNALGAAGDRQSSDDPDNSEFLSEPGQSIAVSPGPGGFKSIQILAQWNHIEEKKTGFLQKIIKQKIIKPVDLDIGCLYELQDGTRGAIQAFGEKFGDSDIAPYILLSGDERTGEAQGIDEYLMIKGQHWDKIKRLLVYLYIYEAHAAWKDITPRVVVDIPGQNDLIVTLKHHSESLALCVIGGLENVRGGIKLTNYTEYFPGHAEMDRAFGFGLNWGEGRK